MKDSEVLSSFLPSIIIKELASLTAAGEVITTLPYCQRVVNTVCLFADVSGFTALSEAMQKQHGERGPVFLAKHLNSYFELMARIVAGNGGDILKFAGDAIIVLWPQQEDITLQIRRAIQCGTEIREKLNKAQLTTMDALEPVILSVKIGIGVGDVTILHVGGVLQQLEYVATGDPLAQAFAAEHLAVAGEVVIAPKVYHHVKDLLVGCETVVDGSLTYYKLGQLRKRVKKVSVSNVVHLSDYRGLHLTPRIRQYLPRCIISLVGNGGEFWGSELRRITVLFANLGFSEGELSRLGTSSPAGHDVAIEMQEILEAAQIAIMRFGGTLNKFLCDDKGSTLLAAFGLPPSTHSDDESRAIMASLDVMTRLSYHDRLASVGVTTGKCFCGVVGGNMRREYSVLGDVVNTAARLMQYAKTQRGGGVLCGAMTRLRCKNNGLFFESIGQIGVKGKVDPIAVFQPYPCIKMPGKKPFNVIKTNAYGNKQERTLLVDGEREELQVFSGIEQKKAIPLLFIKEMMIPEPLMGRQSCNLIINFSSAQRSYFCLFDDEQSVSEFCDQVVMAAANGGSVCFQMEPLVFCRINGKHMRRVFRKRKVVPAWSPEYSMDDHNQSIRIARRLKRASSRGPRGGGGSDSVVMGDGERPSHPPLSWYKASMAHLFHGQIQGYGQWQIERLQPPFKLPPFWRQSRKSTAGAVQCHQRLFRDLKDRFPKDVETISASAVTPQFFRHPQHCRILFKTVVAHHNGGGTLIIDERIKCNDLEHARELKQRIFTKLQSMAAIPAGHSVGEYELKVYQYHSFDAATKQSVLADRSRLDIAHFVSLPAEGVELSTIPLLVFGQAGLHELIYSLGPRRCAEEGRDPPDAWKDVARILSSFLSLKIAGCRLGHSDCPYRTIVIEGDVGVGKSRLLSNLVARAAPFMVVIGAGNQYQRDSSSCLFTFVQMIDRLLNLVLQNLFKGMNPHRMNTQHINTMKVMVIEALMERCHRDNVKKQNEAIARVSQMLRLKRSNDSSQVRGDIHEYEGVREEKEEEEEEEEDNADKVSSTRVSRHREDADAIVDIIRQFHENWNILMVIDDAMHLDPYSWDVLLRLQRVKGKEVPMILSVKRGEIYKNYLLRLPSTTYVSLNCLPRIGVIRLVKHVLGATLLSQELLDVVDFKSAGNPLMAKELILHLCAKGMVKASETGTVTLVNTDHTTKHYPTPPSVSYILREKVDSLDFCESLALKVCATVVALQGGNNSIKVQFVEAAFPLEGRQRELRRALFALLKKNLLEEVPEHASVAGVGTERSPSATEGCYAVPQRLGSSGASNVLTAQEKHAEVRFTNGFLPEFLCGRMLDSQKMVLQRKVLAAVETEKTQRREQDARKREEDNFLEALVAKLGAAVGEEKELLAKLHGLYHNRKTTTTPSSSG